MNFPVLKIRKADNNKTSTLVTTIAVYHQYTVLNQSLNQNCPEPAISRNIKLAGRYNTPKNVITTTNVKTTELNNILKCVTKIEIK